MISLGIDYDARAWTVATWDEDRAADLHTFERMVGVWDFVEDLTTAHPATPIVLPSGFGIPVTRAREILDRDIFEMTLQRKEPTADGLGLFLAEARRRPLRTFCIPAVKLLSSVPPHRKLNRLDLGTSDSLCAAAWAIHSLSQHGRAYAACDFVLLHLGINTRTLLVVQAGRIVDGIGGTTGWMGSAVGGAREMLRDSLTPSPGRSCPSGGTEDEDARLPGARQVALWEAVEKESVALLGFHRLSEVIVTGVRRLEACKAVGERLPLVPLPSTVDGYEGALGAAVIAAGLTGGSTARLVDHLGIRQARERVLDWITL